MPRSDRRKSSPTSTAKGKGKKASVKGKGKPAPGRKARGGKDVVDMEVNPTLQMLASFRSLCIQIFGVGASPNLSAEYTSTAYGTDDSPTGSSYRAAS